ncbi:MAG: dockerin type I repeat-containing protein [candidate division Zixibacteria bacterium]|nr:dockerin type I repeat-containing protein [candidate division Zixibacteria bacterium]
MKVKYLNPRLTHLLFMLGLSIFLFAKAVFAVEDYAVTVKRDADGCTVHVIFQIVLYQINPANGLPENVPAGDVTNVQNALNACLGGLICAIPCVRPPNCKVDVKAEVKNWSDVPAADKDKYAKVEMKDYDVHKISKSRIGKPNGQNGSGIWRRGGPNLFYMFCHETLHLAGLPDRYCGLQREIVRIDDAPGWCWSPPFVDGEPNCKPGTPDPCDCVFMPGKPRCTKPCVGYEDDAMAQPGGWFKPKHILDIVNLAAVADPALNTCPEVPCCPGPCDTPHERIWGGLPPSYYCWGNPSRYGDRFLNESFNMPPDQRGRLDKIEIAFKLTGSTGTPDPDLYVWLSDGLYPRDDNPPSQAIGHFHIPYDSILWDTSYTVVETWEQGIVFNPGEQFHIGYAHAYTPGDSLLVLSDDGANNSNRSVEWALPGQWGTILDDWGYGVDFFINAMICPYTPYVCGDCNGDSVINAADVVYLINYLFIEGPGPDPLCIADVNHDGQVNAADVVYLINYLFIQGPAPSPDCCARKKIEKDSSQIRSAPRNFPKSPGDLERIE